MIGIFEKNFRLQIFDTWMLIVCFTTIRLDFWGNFIFLRLWSTEMRVKRCQYFTHWDKKLFCYLSWVDWFVWGCSLGYQIRPLPWLYICEGSPNYFAILWQEQTRPHSQDIHSWRVWRHLHTSTCRCDTIELRVGGNWHLQSVQGLCCRLRQSSVEIVNVQG